MYLFHWIFLGLIIRSFFSLMSSSLERNFYLSCVYLSLFKSWVIQLHKLYSLNSLIWSNTSKHRNLCSICCIYLLSRYAYPWWRDKEINSEEKRSQGLCPLTPEETTLILQALGFDKDTQVYIASGEIYGSERRLAALRAAFPNTVRDKSLLSFIVILPLQLSTTLSDLADCYLYCDFMAIW